MLWVPSHIDLLGNEQADRAAKYAASASVIMDDVMERLDLQRPIAKQGHITTQRNHPTSTLYNAAHDIPKQRPSFAPKVECGKSLPSEATLDASLRSYTKQTLQIDRNLRLPYNEVCKDMNAFSESTSSRPQRNQRHQAMNFDPYLAKAEPIAIQPALKDSQGRVNEGYTTSDDTGLHFIIADQRVTATVDIGTTTSFMAEAQARENKKTCRRDPYRLKVRLHDVTALETNSAFTCPVQFGDRATHLHLVVMLGAAEPLLLGYKTATCRPSETLSQAPTAEPAAETIPNAARGMADAFHESPRTIIHNHNTTEEPRLNTEFEQRCIKRFFQQELPTFTNLQGSPPSPSIRSSGTPPAIQPCKQCSTPSTKEEWDLAYVHGPSPSQQQVGT
uniref:RNase H type-1 domain-containing protein n=1 Tax=Glossina morsitans morsitans TaxID=37546 RepID=A0A1B0GBW4_GLOMM